MNYDVNEIDTRRVIEMSEDDIWDTFNEAPRLITDLAARVREAERTAKAEAASCQAWMERADRFEGLASTVVWSPPARFAYLFWRGARDLTPLGVFGFLAGTAGTVAIWIGLYDDGFVGGLLAALTGIVGLPVAGACAFNIAADLIGSAANLRRAIARAKEIP